MLLLKKLSTPRNYKASPLTLSHKVDSLNLQAIRQARLTALADELALLTASIKPMSQPIAKKIGRQPTNHTQREGGQEVRNGIRRPKPDTKCGQSWQVCQDLFIELGHLPLPAQVGARGLTIGLKENTSRSEFSMWRIFHFGR
ncbi:hypothetical protein UFOVP1516_51 [uncultured Caudovirales phage]|uniref:Uncharacterized protein n=1 Tax=uncultured Caudovirales phage TaxID=2100421 RepID=A0A6J7XA74_9CAUD|nr:hypothetical protein UFOVP887_84 [uncultured Caudovirales phage]CAB5226889.1 hypothetical protein UFOVP1516_51 [uncultured Caudovirales phage]